jgi:hypothetical protein
MSAEGGMVLAGAKGRLLPASIPFSFFAAAIVFHIAAWGCLVIAADEVPAFAGGLGLPLAALHLITLGVLTMTAFGAAFQLLPVATRQAMPAPVLMRAVFLLLALGALALTHGMASLDVVALAAGGCAVVAAMLLGAILLSINLLQNAGMPVVLNFARFAVAGLFGVTVLGALLAFAHAGVDVGEARSLAAMHVIVGGYGFMGLLAMGFSYVLVPMFGLSSMPDRAEGLLTAFAAAGAVALGVAGALAGSGDVVIAAGVAGMIAAGLHLRGMAQALGRRMKRRLGVSFLLVRVAWAMLPLSILAGVAAQFDLLGPNSGTFFGFLLFFGWLLTFLLGVLQRIMPFLASMHAAKAGRQPPLVTELSSRSAMTVHAVCHLAAIGLVAAGILAGSGALVRIGAMAGLLGAIAFLWFGWQVVSRMWRRQAAGRTGQGGDDPARTEVAGA